MLLLKLNNIASRITMSKYFSYLNNEINSYLTNPEANAAARMGIFRILYALFYFWFLSSHFAVKLASLPPSFFNRIVLTELFPKPLPEILLTFVESILVVALVFLVVGYKTRIATGFVLVFGCFLESFYYSIYYQHSTLILAFYIPFFMLLFGRWGDTYSLDLYLLKKRERVDKSSSASWEDFLSARCLLIILSMLFFSAGLHKLFGTWLSDSDLVANHVMIKNIKSAIYNLPLNNLAPWIAQTPIIYNFLRFFTIFFELFFFLVLFSSKLRPVILATALIFHSVNAIWFAVTFTPVLIIYGLFIDWQACLSVLLPKRSFKFNFLAPRWLIMGTIFLAVAIGVLWNSVVEIRAIFNLGGIVTWHTIWYLILPLSIVWLLVSLLNFLPIKKLA